jgi:hypothetical protein
MASKKLVRPAPPRKPPRVIGAFPSKLLHDCSRCGRPVFTCWVEKTAQHLDVEVLETPVGDVALQSTLLDDEIAAVVVASPRTWYRFHLAHCKGAFSVTQLRKVRS